MSSATRSPRRWWPSGKASSAQSRTSRAARRCLLAWFQSPPETFACSGSAAFAHPLCGIRRTSMHPYAKLIWAVLLVACSGAARAQEQETRATKLEGTLSKVDTTGAMTLGYREASFPLSYTSKAGPVGYSIDLCLAVVEEIKREIDRAEVKVNYKLVTPET